MKSVWKINDSEKSPHLSKGTIVKIADYGRSYTTHTNGKMYEGFVEHNIPTNGMIMKVVDSFFCTTNRYWIYVINDEVRTYLMDINGLDYDTHKDYFEENLFKL